MSLVRSSTRVTYSSPRSRYATSPTRSLGEGLPSWASRAICQIFALAPAMRPPIDPVVSRAKTRSTLGGVLADVGCSTGSALVAGGETVWGCPTAWDCPGGASRDETFASTGRSERNKTSPPNETTTAAAASWGRYFTSLPPFRLDTGDRSEGSAPLRERGAVPRRSAVSLSPRDPWVLRHRAPRRLCRDPLPVGAPPKARGRRTPCTFEPGSPPRRS